MKPRFFYAATTSAYSLSIPLSLVFFVVVPLLF
jgi:hypothetical protein